MPATIPAPTYSPVAGFVAFLRQNGFAIGLDRYSRFLAVLDRIGPDCPPSQLKTIICPLFATTAAEQDRFHQLFEAYFPHFALDGAARAASTELDSGRVVKAAARKHTQNRRFPRTMWLALAATLLVALAVIAYIGRSSDAEQRGPTATRADAPAQTTDPAVARAPDVAPINTVVPTGPISNQSRQSWFARNTGPIALGASMSILLLFVAGEWRAQRRRRLLLERERRAKPPLTWPIRAPQHRNPYQDRPDIHSAARTLRAREASDSYALDIERTVQATVAALGLPSFQYHALTRPPEYLVLIERASRRDHQAELFRLLTTALEEEGVHIAAYTFRDDPRVCHLDDGSSVSLTELRRRYPDHRLLILGTGEGLTDPITGHLLGWVPQLLAWKDGTLLTPIATTHWGAAEMALASHFLVLPATVGALGAIVESARLPARLSQASDIGTLAFAAPAPTSSNVVAHLRGHLSEAMVQWVCACAVYPEIQWNLTLALGSLPELGSLVTEANLIELARLPWFRSGSMPDDVRRALLDAITPAVERAARARIVELLESNPAPAGAVATLGYELQLLVQRISLERQQRAREARARRAIRTLPDRDIARDVAIVRLAEESSATSIALILPARLRRLFFRGGIAAFGWRTGLWPRLGLAASAILVVLTAVAVGSASSANRRLAQNALVSTRALAALTPNPVDAPSLDALQRLDAARQMLDTLSRYEREGGALSRKMGLYRGAEIHAQVRASYFDSFNKLMFAGTRSAMLVSLRGLPDTPRPTDDYGETYNLLKTYIITTTHPEKSTPTLAPALMARWLMGRGIDSSRAQLARRQFETYANELRFANPFPDTADAAAVAKARSFLRQFAGSERIYQYLLAEAAKANPPIQFNRDVPGSGRYIVVPYGVPGPFTKGGATFILNALRTIDGFLTGEAWVVGEDAGGVDKAKLVAELRSRYAADYAAEWRKFLSSAQVVPYAGMKDAAARLAVLSGNQSPLLALFFTASQNTNIPLPEVAAAFQSVQLLTPSTVTDKLIGEKNQAYMNALLGLQSAIDQTANASGSAAERAAGRASRNASSTRMAARQLAAGFNIDQRGNVQAVVQSLMEAPIAYAEPYLRNFGASEINGRARAFCAAARQTLAKFPFAADATEQASLAEVTALLKPGSGSLWKFYDDVLAASVPRQGNQFVQNPTGIVNLTPGFVTLLNKAAQFADILFRDNSPEPRISLTVQPVPSQTFASVSISLDGELVRSTLSGTIQSARIDWPGATQHEARLSAGGVGSEITVVGPFSGPWAVFQLFNAADGWRQVQNGYQVLWERRNVVGLTRLVAVQIYAGSADVVLRRGFFAGSECAGDIARTP